MERQKNNEQIDQIIDGLISKIELTYNKVQISEDSNVFGLEIKVENGV